jgi:triosephosphate isomerase
LGAQTIHPEKLGAYTGSVSLPMLESYQVSHVLVGHSERRRAGEDDAAVSAQVQALVKQSVTAIVCIGETTRDHGAHYFSVIEKQIRAALAGLPRSKVEKVVLAYEPVWAIGSGVTPAPADIHEMKIFIEKTLTDLYGRSVASKVRILYGGSVSAANAAELSLGGHMDGFLVGGASLIPADFITIVKAAVAEYA